MELNEVSCTLKRETSGGSGSEEALKGMSAKLVRPAEGQKYFKTIDCGTVLGIVLWNLRAAIEKNDAAITLDELPIVKGDETQLIQLFLKLVGNALKYRSERTPHIHVSAKCIQEIYGLTFEDTRMQSAIRSLHSTVGKAWLFSVTDNGVGIDPLCFEQIFKHLSVSLRTKKSIREWVSASLSAKKSQSNMAAASGSIPNPAWAPHFISRYRTVTSDRWIV